MPPGTNALKYWKVNIYYQVMDNIISNLKRRFENLPLAKSVDSFLMLDLDQADEFVANYKDVFNIDISALKAEVLVTRNLLKNKNLEISLNNLKSQVKSDLTPNLYKLLQVAVGLPVSSAGCERSFSAMRRIKTWLRNTMIQDRFSNLSLLNIENQLVKQKLPAEEVLNVFVKKDRKLKLV